MKLEGLVEARDVDALRRDECDEPIRQSIQRGFLAVGEKDAGAYRQAFLHPFRKPGAVSMAGIEIERPYACPNLRREERSF
jgi:hypothetical protein